VVSLSSLEQEAQIKNRPNKVKMYFIFYILLNTQITTIRAAIMIKAIMADFTRI
jgi:hypothetical protein